MPDHDWLKAKLEQINDRTELTHQLLQQRLDTLSEKVHANTTRSKSNATKLHANEVEAAKASSGEQSVSRYRASVGTKVVTVITVIGVIFGSCLGLLSFLKDLLAG